MGNDRFARLASIFDEARELPAGERTALLDRVCVDDAALRAEIEGLLARHDDDGVLDDPIRAITTLTGPIPERVAGFTITGLLGRGGMGVVYRAEQDQPQRTVALKMMHAGLMTPDLLKRFEFETSVLARLQHPGIAQIYEVGTWDDGSGGRPFFAMELIDGATLEAHIHDARPPTDERLRLFIALCDAVQHAHQKGVIHRDLKPGNVLVTSDGRPKVLDFGVARATDADKHATMATAAGQLVGTLAYMSPEQVAASGDGVDTRSDVYSLGVILYELLTGRLPYDLGKTSIAAAARVIEEIEPLALTSVNRALKGDLNTIVLTALRKRPDERYQTAADLAADVRRYLDHQPITARPATALYQITRFAQRHRGLVAMVAIALMVLIGSSVAVAWQAAIARDEARTRAEVAAFLHEMLTSIDPNETGGDTPTVRDMLDDAAARLGDRFEDARLVRAELHNTMAITYSEIGARVDAEHHITRAVADFTATLGSHAEPTLRAKATQALLLADLDRLEEAESVLREIIALDQPLNIESAQRAAENLAIVLDGLGRHDEAETLYRRVYQHAIGFWGNDDRNTLRAQGNLGDFLRRIGKVDEALSLIEARHETHLRTLPADHPDTIRSLSQLGALYGALGRLEEAAAVLREAADAAERVLGPTHLVTIRRWRDLAVTEFQLGNHDAAQSRINQHLTQCETHFGIQHDVTLSALETSVMITGLTGDLPAAEAMALDWFTRVEAEMGTTHRATGRVAFLLQNIYDEWQKTDEREAWRARVEASTFIPTQQ